MRFTLLCIGHIQLLSHGVALLQLLGHCIRLHLLGELAHLSFDILSKPNVENRTPSS